MTTCPTCHGRKVLVGIGCPSFKPIEIPCLDCKGAGELDDVRMLWRKHGRMIRRFRIARERSLRDEAKWLGVKASELSDAENGRIDPVPIWQAGAKKMREELWAAAGYGPDGKKRPVPPR